MPFLASPPRRKRPTIAAPRILGQPDSILLNLDGHAFADADVMYCSEVMALSGAALA